MKEALKVFKGIKNFITPRGIIKTARIKVLETKIKEEKIPIKIFFNLIITFIRVMVLKINNQLTQRIYFYDIRNFRRFVLQLLLFSYKDQYHTHQSLQLHHAFEHLHLRH